jgi:CRP-like cAMP-binding protein
VEANECIFAKDDLGSVAYIIAEGRIRIHDGEREIAVLGEREVFGELAVLDPEPRSASATALEDGLLFSIAEDKLYQLLAEHAAVANGIIRVLCQRLRS